MKTRRITLALAACATLSLGLTACGPDDAPTAVAPTSAATQTSSSSSDSSAASTSDSSTPSSTSSDTSSSSSSDSSSSSSSDGSVPSTSPAAGGAGQCNDDSATSWSVKSSATKMNSFGQVVSTSYDGYNSVPMEITVQKPTTVQAADDYSVDDGYQLLVFDVKMDKKGGDGYASAFYLDFTLTDDGGHLCDNNGYSSAVPSAQRLKLTSLTGSITSASGKIAFAVPKGKDYSKYTLLWAGGKDDGEAAQVGWQG